MHTFICRQGLITYNWAVTEVASIQCGLMIFSTNMVTALTLSCMLSTQMDKITYPPLWRHSWKTVQNKDIVARPKWKRREFPTICFQSQLSSIIFTGFMAFWSLTKKNFLCNFLKFSMHERVKTHSIKSGIRTHAYRSRLRPERSALDHSAILTVAWHDRFI